MKANNYRNMTTEQLSAKLTELKSELFNLRFQLATGQLENPLQVKFVKKDIARVKTFLNEKERNS
ncbi:MAG: 50S ribosomal protein L29 [Peptostreptococcaceae bacterium]|nr:50S ribosomal protein L29 [Peptostreptococcaceae bacterium]